LAAGRGTRCGSTDRVRSAARPPLPEAKRGRWRLTSISALTARSLARRGSMHSENRPMLWHCRPRSRPLLARRLTRAVSTLAFGSSLDLGLIAHHALIRSGRDGGTAVTSKFHERWDNLELDDQQELGRCGPWLLRSAIAEVLRRPKSRTVVAGAVRTCHSPGGEPSAPESRSRDRCGVD